MASVLQKLQIVEAVVGGATFRQAGKLVGLSGARAGKNFDAACKELGIPRDIDELRRQPQTAIEAVRKKRQIPTVTLPEHVLRKLLAPSGYKLNDLTPENIASKAGSDVLHKFGPEVLLEVHNWLATHGLAMRVTEGDTPHDRAAIDQALVVLKTYGISVNVTQSSLPLWQGAQG